MVGKTEYLVQKKTDHWKAKSVDLSALLFQSIPVDDSKTYCCMPQEHGLDHQINYGLIEQSKAAIENKKPVEINLQLKNVNRTVGTLLSAEISRKYGEAGLPEGTIKINASGSAGQSFGAFTTKGISFELVGEANDYLGKGLSGAEIVLRPPENITYEPQKNVIVGNVCFYGATSGRAYIRGIAGERFCVRNSGVEVVVSSIGDHGCEYMTGGRVLILGAIGINFAAGMSGGISYIYDPDGDAKNKINLGMVDIEEPSEEDESWILGKIKLFVEKTQAIESEYLISDWTKVKKNFIKIMPRDYKKALQRLKEGEKIKETVAS